MKIKRRRCSLEKIYQKTSQEVLDYFKVNSQQGLNEEEVQQRLEQYSENVIQAGEQLSVWEILWHNINNIIVYLLAAASLLSFFMNEYIEAFAVFIALLIAVFTGFFVEYKAQKSIDSLQKMIVTKVKVIRSGKLIEVDAAKIVPGDILRLEEGDPIAADGRIVESRNFAVIEAALTGEAESVEKNSEVLDSEDLSIGDRRNMVFSGTAVTRGNASVVVTATGMESEVGKISALLTNQSDQQTPLDRELNRLGKALIVLAAIAALLVVVIGLLTKQDWTSILHIAIILAVAAIPEALPAVSTITLSRGMGIMAEHQALVKTLSAVETLGSTSVIASDKTGTLTENQMTVEKIILKDNHTFSVKGTGYVPKGDIVFDDVVLNPDGKLDQTSSDSEELRIFIRDGLLASNAQLTKESSQNNEDVRATDYSIIGDPTEGALVVLAGKIGLSHSGLQEEGWEKESEIPFDSDVKYMAVVYSHPQPRLIVKGAPDVLFDLFAQDTKEHQYWEKQNEHLANEGMRVLAIASLELSNNLKEPIESLLEKYAEEIQILGVVGIMDPPREDVKASIQATQEAGIQVKMITGDHPKTASVIANEIGLKDADKTMTGNEIDRMHGTPEFKNKVLETAVFARVSPENKLQIVTALQKEGKIVAMTGDGVNDAPALNGADIGVAMGIRGTEVAKEASDMILTDDRFSTIVDAVRQGRVIFANIKKYVSFLFTCNMVEITAVLLSVLFLLPMPIQPLHILFLNLVIDIGPAMAIAFEPAEQDVMKEPVRDVKNGLVNKRFLMPILLSGISIGISAFGLFIWMYHQQSYGLEYIQTATFAFMAIAQLGHVFNVRRQSGFGLDKTLLANKVLILALISSLGLLLFSLYVPFMQTVFQTEPITLGTWGVILVLASVVTYVVKFIQKIIY